MSIKPKRKLLSVVMDGVGVRQSTYGNAVLNAPTPHLEWLKGQGHFTTIRAHGTAVGLPTDGDIGNSEVGHNALGAGQVYDQGAKLVNNAIESGSLYEGKTWQTAVTRVKTNGSTLHFLGLVSDGNVHSHIDHLTAMLKKAAGEGVGKIRVHALMDGRDVPARSAEKYVDQLESVISDIRQNGCDIAVASGGGRMTITMDRYGANWSMVEKGWNTHVRGVGQKFGSMTEAISKFREDPDLIDQDFPPFVIATSDGKPLGPVESGDSVIFFNFRGDRSIEISKAFSDDDFPHFDRSPRPDVFYCGMMEYDGDEHVPSHYLVNPPLIEGTMGEKLADLGVRQFACSETQKYGHVTFFWNGNRTGYFDEKSEKYVEIPSDVISFNLKPWMKATEITDATVAELKSEDFQFGRINYANGDMVGHTGDYDATVIGVATVDLMIGRLIKACRASDTILVVTADHGNADQMFEGKEATYPRWEDACFEARPPGKTSHTLSEVPFIIYDPLKQRDLSLMEPGKGTLANFANTAFDLMGLPSASDFFDSLIVQ